MASIVGQSASQISAQYIPPENIFHFIIGNFWYAS